MSPNIANHWLEKAIEFIESHDGWVVHPGQDLHGYLLRARDDMSDRPKIERNHALEEHMKSLGFFVTRSSIHQHDIEFYAPRQVIVCRSCTSGCDACASARSAIASFADNCD